MSFFLSMKFLLLLSTLTLVLSQCTFSIPDTTISDIKLAVKRATFLRLTIPNHTAKNLSSLNYFVARTTSLFLLEPSSSFYTFGLIARDFYVVNVPIMGGFCNTTNNVNTPRIIDKDTLFMQTMYNKSIAGQTDNRKFFICSQQLAELALNPFSIQRAPIKNYFTLRRDEYVCCDEQQTCTIQSEPFVNQVAEWISASSASCCEQMKNFLLSV